MSLTHTSANDQSEASVPIEIYKNFKYVVLILKIMKSTISSKINMKKKNISINKLFL